MPKSARRKQLRANMNAAMCAQDKIRRLCKPEAIYGTHNGRTLSYYPVASTEYGLGPRTYCGGGEDAKEARSIFDAFGDSEKKRVRKEFADKMTIMETAGSVWNMIKDAPYTAAAAAEAGITKVTSTFLNLGVSDGITKEEDITRIQLENQEIEDYYSGKLFIPNETYREYIEDLLNKRLITEVNDQNEREVLQAFISTGNLDSCPRIGQGKKQKKGSKKKRRRSKPKKRKSKRTNNN